MKKLSSKKAKLLSHRACQPPGRASAPLEISYLPIDSLQPAEWNPRVMSGPEQEKLRQSLEHWGIVAPIVIRRADNSVIGGHQRLEVARQLGLVEVPAIFVDITASEAKALNVALNKIHGDWDLPRLAELLEELRSLPELEMDLTGFDSRELDEMLSEIERSQAPKPNEESFDAAAELLQAQHRKAPTRVKANETWQLGRHRLYCGDALAEGTLKKLCKKGKVDILLTDPPYGIGFQSTMGRRGRRKEAIANDGSDDFGAFLEKALPAIKAVMRKGAVLYWFAGGGGGEPVLAKSLLAIDAHFTLLNIIVWDKVDIGLGWRWRRSWEAIIEASLGQPDGWFGGNEKRNVLRYPRAIPQAGEHPTPKPVPLLEEILLAAAPPRGIVLDPFAGSGSTLIAAERTGRTCYLSELVPRYADIILARWESLTGQEAKNETEG